MHRNNSETAVSDSRATLDALMERNREMPDSNVEQALIDQRIRACKQPGWREARAPWSQVHDQRFDGTTGIPEIAFEDLDAPCLKAAILGRGGLIVRGLMPAGEVQATRERIQRTIAARSQYQEGAADEGPWYRRSSEVQGRPAEFRAQGNAQNASASSTVWAADSPRTAFHLIEFYQRIGLPELLEAYFAEPAVLSVRKWVLRCIDPANLGAAGWHQDGRFLGEDIKTVNLWLALSDCGGDADAPGIDIVPGGERRIHETGTRGAAFDWTVGQGVVDEASRANPPVCPRFAPGDAIFFDHFNLHRSASSDHHRSSRYAVESWFFASSTAPDKQMPVML